MTATAAVLAGSRPEGDEFAARLGAPMKALIPVAGRPMVARPVEALLESGRFGRVIVLAQKTDDLARALPADDRLSVRPSGATIAATIAALCGEPDLHWPLLVTTADHALLDAQMVGEVMDAASGCDIAIGVVERGNLLRRLPQTKRTWLKFRGGAFTGANLFVLASPAVRPAIDLWRSVEQDRKKSWRLISLAGPVVLLAAALRLLSIDDVLVRLGARLGIGIRAVRMSNPLAGVDVDKVADHELAESILEGRL